MRQRVTILICLIFFSTVSFALPIPSLKGRLYGTIKEGKSGLPLAGVSVFIPDIKTGTITNSKGEYSIANIGEGEHFIEVTHIGYTTVAMQIIIQSDTKKDFLLMESIIENNAVVVTGVTRATQLKKIPFQVSVMRKEDLQQSAASNIIEAISRIAGVSSLSSGPAISKPMIRGLGYNRVLTVHDGVRQEGQQWGDEHGIEIDDASINKIEILKGPAALVYGSDAMAGVINIISNVPVQENSIKMNLGTNFQTVNRLRSVYGNISGNKNGFNWNLYGTGKAAADYRNAYDGYVFNSKFKEQNFGGYVGYNAGWGYSHILLSNFDLTAGIVEGTRDSAGYFMKTLSGNITTRATSSDFRSVQPQFPYQHIRHFKIAADNSFKIAKSRLAVNVGWQQNQREEFGNPDDPGERALYLRLKTLTYTAQLHFRESNGWKTSAGISGMYQGNTNKGQEQLIPDYQLADFGGYGFLQKDYRNISFSGGLRYDTRKMEVEHLLDGNLIKGVAFGRSFSNYSGSIGAAWMPVKVINIKMNVARAFRAPSIAELATNGVHEGAFRYEYGGINLESEVSTQFDAAVEFSNEHFSLNISGYFNNFNNFIFYRKLESVAGGDSVIMQGGSVLTAFKFDQRKAYLTGMEASLDIHPHPLDWLHIQNSFSLVSGKLREQIEGSDNLPFIPAPRLLTELIADISTRNLCLKNFYIKLELDNYFKQSRIFSAYNTETVTPAYFLINAGMGTDIIRKNGQKLAGINLTIANITDIAYQNHLSRLKYADENLGTGRRGIFNMGRNVSIKMTFPFQVFMKK